MRQVAIALRLHFPLSGTFQARQELLKNKREQKETEADQSNQAGNLQVHHITIIFYVLADAF